MPTPLSAVRVHRSGPDWNAIDRLVAEWAPAGFVVGVALNADKAHTAISRRAERFAGRLEQRYRRAVHRVDETLTTEAARGVLRAAEPEGRLRKADVDNTAAALILESFLQARR